MSDQETSVVGGIPGLVNIPLLGKYLGNTSKDRQKEQLMIALIPHIVRKREITGLDLKGIAAGTDQEVKLTYSPGAQESTPTATAYTATVPASPAPNNAAVTPSSSGAAPGLVFDPVKVPAPVGSQVKLALRAENIADLAIVRVKLQWDPMVLRLETISPGPLLTEEGTVVVPSVDIRNDTGDATIDVNRATGVGKVNGTDPLLQLTFTAMAKGTTTVAVTEASVKTSKQRQSRSNRPRSQSQRGSNRLVTSSRCAAGAVRRAVNRGLAVSPCLGLPLLGTTLLNTSLPSFRLPPSSFLAEDQMLSMTLSTKEEPRRLAPLAVSETSGEPVVFVVEDDFRIRHLICTLLRRATRAVVIEAANPYAALSTARNFAGRIDLLISDVNLSASLNGVDLARALITRTPSMKVLLISAADRPQCEIPPAWRFLAKPFSMESFLECVRALSDSASRHCTSESHNTFLRG